MSVNLVLEPQQAQRRGTILVRWILGIPAFIFAALLGQVVQILVVIAWFAALFTKRVPYGLADFMAKVLRYTTRTYAYGLFLMTDRYPPFDIEGTSPYPVDLEVDITEEHNRAAILFRALLMTPKLVVFTIVQIGSLIMLFVAWIAALVMGRLPDSFFGAHAAVLRYQMRIYAYGAMLTSEYPRRLFGDPPEEVEADAAGAGMELDETGMPLPTRSRTLDLGGGAKLLVVLFLVLGSLFPIGATVAAVAIGVNAIDAAELLDRHDDLTEAIDAWSVDAQACALAGGPQCLREANFRLQGALQRFRADLADLDVSGSASFEADAVDDDVQRMIAILDDMSAAETAEAYAEHASRFLDAADDFDRDFDDLYDEILF